MLMLNNADWELPQIGKEPTVGYEDEYVEKTMISGKIRRIYKGRRFYGNFSYAFLTTAQRDDLQTLLLLQRTNGYIDVKISTPYGSFEGQAIIDVDASQTRFRYDTETGEYVWTNWRMSIKAVDYDS
jgi:hypothetical protein